MVTMTYSNLSSKKIVRAIREKNNGKYVMIYLYDGYKEMNDDKSETNKLFVKYGKTINNRLGNDIHLLTVYDRNVIKAWGNDFMGKKKLLKSLTYQETMDSKRSHYSTMVGLADIFGVDLPAVVLLDKEVNGNGLGKEAKLEFGSSSAEDIFRTITGMIDAIRYYYGDFERIAKECDMGTKRYDQKDLENTIKQGTLKDIVDLYMDKAHITQKNLCEKLGISTRHFRRYMDEWDKDGAHPLPRDTAIAIAFLLKLSPEQADAMFDAAQVGSSPTWEHRPRRHYPRLP